LNLPPSLPPQRFTAPVPPYAFTARASLPPQELLDLRKIEVTLAKQCEYAEAQKVRVYADEMEAQVREGGAGVREEELGRAVGVISVKRHVGWSTQMRWRRR
jgi:hypothetical protein